MAEREKAVLELEQLARAAHDRLTQFAEEEVTRRWTQLEEVGVIFHCMPSKLVLTEILANAKGVTATKRSTEGQVQRE